MTRKTEFQILDPDTISARLTCTASIRTWRNVEKALSDIVQEKWDRPTAAILESVREVIGAANAHFASCSEPEQNETKT